MSPKKGWSQEKKSKAGKKHVTETKDFSKFKGEGLLRIDLACGQHKRPNFVGVDIAKTDAVEVVHDLNVYPYPFKDNSVFEIYCGHFIEHVADIKKFMEECYRILNNQAVMLILAPYYSAVGAVQDFTHVRSISEMTFVYFNQEWLRNSKLGHYDVNCNFDVASMRYYFDPEWISRSEQAKEWARKHYINCVKEIEVTLRKIPME